MLSVGIEFLVQLKPRAKVTLFNKKKKKKKQIFTICGNI